MTGVSRHVTVAILTGFVLVSGCGSGADSRDTFWPGLRFQGEEAESYSTLREMTAAADAVVIGRFAEFGEVRIIQGDTPEGAVNMISGQLIITTHVSGADYASPLPLEFVVVEQGVPVEETIAGLRDSYPRGDMLVFIREKRDASGRYRIINSTGLIVESEAGLVSPLGETLPLSDGPYATEVSGTDDLQELATLVGNW